MDHLIFLILSARRPLRGPIHVLESFGNLSKMFVISRLKRFQEKLFADILSNWGTGMHLQCKPNLPLQPGLAEKEFRELLSEH
ncbi:MAG TPA: hypothetical protein VNY04_05035 [Chthoniobacterales bacterium]|nr:hypothetical protein [Chthoniobacterales bacterium]